MRGRKKARRKYWLIGSKRETQIQRRWMTKIIFKTVSTRERPIIATKGETKVGLMHFNSCIKEYTQLHTYVVGELKNDFDL